MDWIELGYLGMFVAAILAATLLPFGSEAVFIGLLYKDFDPFTLTIVAGTGNTIGGMVTYYIGRLGKWEWLNKWFGVNYDTVKKHMLRAQRFGWLYAFLTWLPGIGDPIAAIIGYVRVNVWVALAWMFLGKTTRFATIAIIWIYGIELW